MSCCSMVMQAKGAIGNARAMREQRATRQRLQSIIVIAVVAHMFCSRNGQNNHLIIQNIIYSIKLLGLTST